MCGAGSRRLPGRSCARAVPRACCLGWDGCPLLAGSGYPQRAPNPAWALCCTNCQKSTSLSDSSKYSFGVSESGHSHSTEMGSVASAADPPRWAAAPRRDAERREEASLRPGCRLALLSQWHGHPGRSSVCLLSSPEDAAALPLTNTGQGTPARWLRDPRRVPCTAQLSPDDVSRLQEQVCRGQFNIFLFL